MLIRNDERIFIVATTPFAEAFSLKTNTTASLDSYVSFLYQISKQDSESFESIRKMDFVDPNRIPIRTSESKSWCCLKAELKKKTISRSVGFEWKRFNEWRVCHYKNPFSHSAFLLPHGFRLIFILESRFGFSQTNTTVVTLSSFRINI